jgi:hypothetical protein
MQRVPPRITDQSISPALPNPRRKQHMDLLEQHAARSQRIAQLQEAINAQEARLTQSLDALQQRQVQQHTLHQRMRAQMRRQLQDQAFAGKLERYVYHARTFESTFSKLVEYVACLLLVGMLNNVNFQVFLIAACHRDRPKPADFHELIPQPSPAQVHATTDAAREVRHIQLALDKQLVFAFTERVAAKRRLDEAMSTRSACPSAEGTAAASSHALSFLKDRVSALHAEIAASEAGQDSLHSQERTLEDLKLRLKKQIACATARITDIRGRLAEFPETVAKHAEAMESMRSGLLSVAQVLAEMDGLHAREYQHFLASSASMEQLRGLVTLADHSILVPSSTLFVPGMSVSGPVSQLPISKLPGVLECLAETHATLAQANASIRECFATFPDVPSEVPTSALLEPRVRKIEPAVVSMVQQGMQACEQASGALDIVASTLHQCAEYAHLI